MLLVSGPTLCPNEVANDALVVGRGYAQELWATLHAFPPPTPHPGALDRFLRWAHQKHPTTLNGCTQSTRLKPLAQAELIDDGARPASVNQRLCAVRALAQEAPLLAIGDGALGLWSALNEVFPTTHHQRCWNHRTLNVLDKLPKRLWTEVRKKLHKLAEAPSRQECERQRDALSARLRAQGQEQTAACLERDWEQFITFYAFPQEHWVHVRTSNPIESICARVRLRTQATKRMRVRENALYLVFKLVTRLSLNWRGINAPNQPRLLLAGPHFQDGQLILKDARAADLEAAVAA